MGLVFPRSPEPGRESFCYTGQVRPCDAPETITRSLLKSLGINLLGVGLSESPGGRDSEELIF